VVQKEKEKTQGGLALSLKPQKRKLQKTQVKKYAPVSQKAFSQSYFFKFWEKRSANFFAKNFLARGFPKLADFP
jgi:hypothetical protein